MRKGIEQLIKTSFSLPERALSRLGKIEDIAGGIGMKLGTRMDPTELVELEITSYLPIDPRRMLAILIIIEKHYTQRVPVLEQCH